MVFQAGQRIVFIGDSITDARRTRDAGPYGTGYVSLVRAFVMAAHPGLRLTWENRGVGGDTVRDLAARWERDAVATRPDWLAVKVGINDAYRWVAGKPDAPGVPLNEYEDTLRRLLRRAVESTGCQLILGTPYYIEPDRLDPVRAAMDRYGAAVRAIASDFGALLVDTQAAFDAVLAATPATDWADDRVHPCLPGHAVLARAYLSALDGTSTLDGPVTSRR